MWVAPRPHHRLDARAAHRRHRAVGRLSIRRRRPAERAVETARIELAETLPKSLQANARRRHRRSARRTTPARKPQPAARRPRRRSRATTPPPRAPQSQAWKRCAPNSSRPTSCASSLTARFRRLAHSRRERERAQLLSHRRSRSAPDGRTLTMPITNEEDGRTYNVTAWGVRVPRSDIRRRRAATNRTTASSKTARSAKSSAANSNRAIA